MQKKKPTVQTEITTVDAWKAIQKNSKLTLPSGITIEIKPKMNLLEFSTVGHIPFTLLKTAMGTAEKMQSDTMLSDDAIGDGDLDALHNMLREIACVAVVNPPVSKTPQENEMNVYDIKFNDLLHIFQNIVEAQEEEARKVKPFRKE